jgi:hypothetical protein
MKQGRNFVLIAVLLAIPGLVTTTAGQTRPRPSTGPDPLDEIMAGSLFPNIEAIGKAAESFGIARENAAQASQEIAAARKAFWAQYPNGPRFKEVQATFAQKLYAKDVALLTFARVDRRCSGGVRSAQAEALGTVLSAAGANIDGGVAAGASGTFCRWVEAAGGMSASSVTSHPFYESYRRDRDWQELYRAGKVRVGNLADLFNSTDVRWYVMALVWSGMDGDVGKPPRPPSFPDNLERAQQKVDALVKTYGREKVFSVATRVMQAPKVPPDPPRTWALYLANPSALGCGAAPSPGTFNPFRDPSVCFDELVGVNATFAANVAANAVTDAERTEWAAAAASANPLEYARYLYWTTLRDRQQNDPVSTREDRRSQAEAAVSEWIKNNSEADVREAARLVQAAPKDAQGLLSPETAIKLGCPSCNLPGRPCEPFKCFGPLISPKARAAAVAAAMPSTQLGPCTASLQSGKPTERLLVEFINMSKQPRRLFWIDFTGNRHLKGAVMPGIPARWPTFVTHAWQIADNNNACVGTVVITKETRRVEIR